MPEGLGARLAIENGFLILLAVAAAVAELDPFWVILVMAFGWFLVALVELLAWRARPAYAWTPLPPAPYEEAVVAPPAVYEPVPSPPLLEPEPVYPPEPFEPEPVASVPEPEVAAEPEPPPPPAEPSPAPAANVTDYDFAFSRPEPAAADEPAVVAPERQGETGAGFATTLFQRPGARRERIRLEPLRPRPRRRLFGLLPPEAEAGSQPPEDESPPPGEERGSDA